LSNFLGCLDGQILSEITIIIMTTNHVEYLDPAYIRPGRMDVHLNLEYCTYYQIEKMYQKINPNAKNESGLIPEKILGLVKKYLQTPEISNKLIGSET
ncbi:5751_t:CDS:2, partial [Gigaspora margarita]